MTESTVLIKKQKTNKQTNNNNNKNQPTKQRQKAIGVECKGLTVFFWGGELGTTVLWLQGWEMGSGRAERWCWKLGTERERVIDVGRRTVMHCIAHRPRPANSWPSPRDWGQSLGYLRHPPLFPQLTRSVFPFLSSHFRLISRTSSCVLAGGARCCGRRS